VVERRRSKRKKEERFKRTKLRIKTRKTKLSWKAKVLGKKPESWRDLTGSWHDAGLLGALFYVFLGIGLALVAKQTLTFGLSTNTPVVAVISPSMQHDHAQQTHYQWLEQRLGYNKDYIRSWPIPTGFLVGDMPIVQGTDEYKVGDIIVYSVAGQSFPTIHRIIKINEDGTYQTKGDNNSNQLPYEFSVSKEQIHGKVIFIIPKLGYFKVIITKVFGFG